MLLVVLAVVLAAAAFTDGAAPYLADMRERANPLLAEWRARVAPVQAERPHLPAARTAIEDGRTVVRLKPEERSRLGLETARVEAKAHREELQAFGSVLDLARVTELTNSYASARAQLQTAQARAEVSRNAFVRAKSLGPYATTVQVETTEGTYQTDQAALMAAESQVRTLAATAQQEWGPVIGKAIVERSPIVTRLIERTDFLMQVTLPPGETLKGLPAAAFAEVPPQSSRVALRFVSPATRTDQRIQGQSFFYIVAGDSGLLPGMSTLAFVPADRTVTGVLVPEDAVVHWQGGTWVYRGLAENAFVRHPIKSGPPMSDDAYVVEDLAGGTEIVLRGAQALLSEEMKSLLQVSGGADDD
ncbi:efflux RND transporter periplasmic adaptor subunit [Methylobacterium nigriterrae]|uniref:efflux RND transporter periplasmic adaptor subunit n=1 Tax=Methylobacterium nigriterrae TaxID=3127512 RepID=UPI003D67DAD8